MLVRDSKCFKRISSHVYLSLTAGWVGWSTGLVCGHPLDTVKVIQQASARPASILGVVRDIAATEGVWGFFKGMLYPVITAGAINSVFFGVYGVCMDKMKVCKYSFNSHTKEKNL